MSSTRCSNWAANAASRRLIAATPTSLPAARLRRTTALTRRCGKKKTMHMPSTSSVEPIQTRVDPGSRATIRPANWRSRTNVKSTPAILAGSPCERTRSPTGASVAAPVDLELRLAGADARVDFARLGCDREDRQALLGEREAADDVRFVLGPVQQRHAPVEERPGRLSVFARITTVGPKKDW